MENIKSFLAPLAIAILALCLAQPAHGQAAMNKTTLSADSIGPVPASAGTQPTTLYITSTTGMLGTTTYGEYQTYLVIDQEVIGVKTVPSTTSVTVVRGQAGSVVSSHLNGATVWWGPRRYFLNANPAGVCQGGQIAALPAVVANGLLTGNVWNCTGATTTNGVWARTSIGQANSGQSGQTIGLFCTGTTGSAETEFLNGAACSGATTATATNLITAPGVIGNLQTYSSAVAVGGTNKDVLTVMKNGTATTVTCTIAAAAATCSDTTHFVQVAAGDVITYRFVTATSDTAANVSASVGKY